MKKLLLGIMICSSIMITSGCGENSFEEENSFSKPVSESSDKKVEDTVISDNDEEETVDYDYIYIPRHHDRDDEEEEETVTPDASFDANSYYLYF